MSNEDILELHRQALALGLLRFREQNPSCPEDAIGFASMIYASRTNDLASLMETETVILAEERTQAIRAFALGIEAIAEAMTSGTEPIIIQFGEGADD